MFLAKIFILDLWFHQITQSLVKHNSFEHQMQSKCLTDIKPRITNKYHNKRAEINIEKC